MRTDGEVFRFGSFELHSKRRHLICGRERIPLRDAPANILNVFVSHPGEVLSFDVLASAGWGEEEVTPNSVAQALSRLRKVLGTQDDGTPFFENVAGRGYRFMAPVTRVEPPREHADLDALLEPYGAFVKGSAALETLDLDEIARAREAFEHALRAAPDYPAAHIGLANACVLAYEATRIDMAPDVASLQLADDHAQTACRRDPTSGDAWSTLAFVRYCTGDPDTGLAAANRSIALEPHEWRHQVRLGFVSWGGQRLLASKRLDEMYPGLPYAPWFAGTVYIARQRFDAAVDELRAGCAAQDDQRTQTNRFPAVGLHLLHALVLGGRGADAEAIEEASRELTCEGARHVYARECAANSRYTMGALHYRNGRRDAAAAEFQKALAHVPGHGLAIVGLAAASGAPLPNGSCTGPNIVDTAMVKAAGLAVHGKHHDAARVFCEAIAKEDLVSAGWILPVDPLIHATAHSDAWSQACALLRHRAA